MIVCVCNNVSEKDVIEGKKIPKLKCGTCAETLLRLTQAIKQVEGGGGKAHRLISPETGLEVSTEHCLDYQYAEMLQKVPEVTIADKYKDLGDWGVKE